MTDDVQGLGARSAAYVPRIVDAQIDKYLTLFGAIEVSGTKWCGKTWSSLAHAASVTYVDRGSNLQISIADPGYPLAGMRPHVIDEWQRAPPPISSPTSRLSEETSLKSLLRRI